MLPKKSVDLLTVEELREEVADLRRRLSNYELMMNRVFSRIDPKKKLDNTKLHAQVGRIIRKYGRPHEFLRSSSGEENHDER